MDEQRAVIIIRLMNHKAINTISLLPGIFW